MAKTEHQVPPRIRDAAKDLLQWWIPAGRFAWRLSCNQVALTFDDGPVASVTPVILDILAKHDVKATFFVIGARAEQCPELLRRIVAEGHGLGSHTYDHLEVVGLNQAQLMQQLERGRLAIRDACGQDSMLFRPPRGRMDLTSLRRITRLGYRVVQWSRTYSDYRQDGVAALLARIDEVPIRARDIVLLHDVYEDTAQALATILPRWRAANISFATL